MKTFMLNIPIQGKTLNFIFEYGSLSFKFASLIVVSYNLIRKLLGLPQEWIHIPVIYSKEKGGVVRIKNYLF